jgi:hypothetical protein
MTSYAQDLAARYAAGRARLWGAGVASPANTNTRPMLRIVRDVNRKWKLSPVEPEPEAPQCAPLNMLQLCSSRFLLAYAALKHGVKEVDILGAAKPVEIVAARHDAIRLIYRHTQHSMPAVGKIFNRDHTTILHAIRKGGSTSKLVDQSQNWVRR